MHLRVISQRVPDLQLRIMSLKIVLYKSTTICPWGQCVKNSLTAQKWERASLIWHHLRMLLWFTRYITTVVEHDSVWETHCDVTSGSWRLSNHPHLHYLFWLITKKTNRLHIYTLVIERFFWQRSSNRGSVSVNMNLSFSFLFLWDYSQLLCTHDVNYLFIISILIFFNKSRLIVKQGKSEGFDNCDRPSNLKLDSNLWFFSLCDLEIW